MSAQVAAVPACVRAGVACTGLRTLLGGADVSSRAMPLFRLTGQSIEPLSETSFARRGVKERGDPQRLLKTNIAVVAAGAV